MPLVVPPPDNDDEVALQRLYRNAGVPDANTHATVAPPGALLIDLTNLDLYINAGTKAVPDWKLFTRAA